MVIDHNGFYHLQKQKNRWYLKSNFKAISSSSVRIKTNTD